MEKAETSIPLNRVNYELPKFSLMNFKDELGGLHRTFMDAQNANDQARISRMMEKNRKIEGEHQMLMSKLKNLNEKKVSCTEPLQQLQVEQEIKTAKNWHFGRIDQIKKEW